jgi:uncharacterized protein YegL
MNEKHKKILRGFLCERNRVVEESFAQILCERADLRLFFINAGESFTDGRNIILDPGVNEFFADSLALRRAEYFLRLEERFSDNPLRALHMLSRALNIHESLHVIHTNFPSDVAFDPRARTPVRAITLSMIRNIIEDAFIEAVGCDVYDNLEYYLLWWRMICCCSNVIHAGTVDRMFSDFALPDEAEPDEATGETLEPSIFVLKQYLEHMGVFLLYPMVRPAEPPAKLTDYVARTAALFVEGSMCGNARERYAHTQRIFDIIEPLIPKTDKWDTESLERTLFGRRLRSPGSPVPYEHEGKPTQPQRRPWTDENSVSILDADGRLSNRYALRGSPPALRADESQRGARGMPGLPISKANDADAPWDAPESRSDAEENESAEPEFPDPRIVEYSGRDFDCAKMHDDIRIEVEKPPVNMHLKRAYENLYHAHRLSIHSHRARFAQMLRAETDVREDRLLFGQRIASRRLSDPKKRYWQKKVRDTDIPSVAFLLMIDGSGSMEGARREAAMTASVILHEVLRKNNIAHAIVAHRAMYGEALLRHEILVDFGAKDEEKYNLLTLAAEGGTREGLSLYWGERCIWEKSDAEYKVLVMISDGFPAHAISEEDQYYPPASTRDAANAVRRIEERGTRVVAVALDEPDATEANACYSDLKDIYRALVSCTNLRRLPGQLLRLVSKELLR